MFRVLILLLILLLGFEVENFTGFSWSRLEIVSDEDLINSAIRSNYPDIYSNLEELRTDYSGFTPKVYFWHSGIALDEGNRFWDKFFGYSYYYVLLPDALVRVKLDGKAIYKLPRGPIIPPDKRIFGIVGTVQFGKPNYERADNFSISWKDEEGTSMAIVGNCFFALSTSSDKPELTIDAKDKGHITISNKFGYYLEAITLEPSDSCCTGSSQIKINEELFEKSKTCSEAIRKAWPNIGGWAWKR